MGKRTLPSFNPEALEHLKRLTTSSMENVRKEVSNPISQIKLTFSQFKVNEAGGGGTGMGGEKGAAASSRLKTGFALFHYH